MNKFQRAEQLRKALQMFAQTLTDTEAMEIATVYPEWAQNTLYKINGMITYGVNGVGDPQLYRCVQEHTSQQDWTPDVATSLWSPIGLAPDQIPIWSRPTGTHDAYNIGDKVHYPEANSPVYQSLIDGNVYNPDEYAAGWELVV